MFRKVIGSYNKNIIFYPQIKQLLQQYNKQYFSSSATEIQNNNIQDNLFTISQCYFRQENYQKALNALNQLNAQSSDNIQQLKLLAKTQIALQQYEEGLQTFQQIIELSPGDIESNVFSMSILEKISEQPDAEIEIINDRIISHHQEDEGQQVAISLVSLLEEEYDAIPQLLNNIKEFKNEHNAYLAYALLKESYIRQNKLQDAINTLEQGISQCPNYLEDMYFELAKLNNQNNNNIEKEQYYLEKCIEINPNQFDVLVELAWIAHVKNQQALSNQYLEKAMAIENQYSKLYFYRAKIDQCKNELDNAENNLKKCLELDGQNASGQVFNQMGVLYLQKRDFKQAIKYFFDALNQNNQESQYYFNCALGYSMLNEITKAISYYDKGLLLKPTNISALRSKGILQIRQKNYLDAIDTFQLALKIEPNNADVLIQEAIAYHATHNIDKAMEICQNIIKINPQHTQANNYIQYQKF